MRLTRDLALSAQVSFEFLNFKSEGQPRDDSLGALSDHMRAKRASHKFLGSFQNSPTPQLPPRGFLISETSFFFFLCLPTLQKPLFSAFSSYPQAFL